MNKKQKIFLNEEGKYFILKPNERNEIHTNQGWFIFKEGEEKFVSSKGKKFYLMDYYSDYFKFIKKGPQTSHLKDLGVIFSKIMPQKDWIMVEAGSGSGQTLCFFAKYVKEIHSFEIKKEFYEIAKRNLEFLGIDNVYLYNKNLNEIDENIKANFVFLDLGDPWEYLEKINKVLKRKGFLVVYFTTPKQLDYFINEIEEKYKEDFVLVDIFEILERNWEKKKKNNYLFCKPKTIMLSFTSIIAIFRKV